MFKGESRANVEGEHLASIQSRRGLGVCPFEFVDSLIIVAPIFGGFLCLVLVLLCSI